MYNLKTESYMKSCDKTAHITDSIRGSHSTEILCSRVIYENPASHNTKRSVQDSIGGKRPFFPTSFSYTVVPDFAGE